MLATPPVVYSAMIETRYAFSPDLYAAFFWPHSLDSLTHPLVPSLYEWWSEWTGRWHLVPILFAGEFLVPF